MTRTPRRSRLPRPCWDGAPLRQLAAVSGIAFERAAVLLDRLVAVGVLDGGPTVSFVHPLVRQAVYEALPAGARTVTHRLAAQHLLADGEEVERACAHLLRCEPAGSAAVVATLRRGARQALARAAPESAIAYLSRALAEPPPRRGRSALLVELARAERLVRHPQAAAHLKQALALERDPLKRASLFKERSEILGLAGEWDRAYANLAQGLLELHGQRGERAIALRARLEAYRVGLIAYDPKRAQALAPSLPELIALSQGGERPMRTLAAALAQLVAWQGADLGQAAALLDHALGQPRIAELIEAEPLLAMRALAAALLLAKPDTVKELVQALLVQAKRQGSLLAEAVGRAYRAAVACRWGDLREAGADLRAVSELCEEHALGFTLPSALWFAVEALIERPELADLARAANTTALPADLARTASGALLEEVRGRLALAAGEPAPAAGALARAGAVYRQLGLLNPSASPWRSELALSLRAENPRQALTLAREELRCARRLELPGAQATALRALALIEGGERGIRRLVQASKLAERARAPLLQARVLLDLGSALRRANRRAAAREPLLAAMDLAQRIGADRLLERAQLELRAVGARPRRSALQGPAALTAAERRVAELAARGLSNPQIACELYVTINTVEGHLRQVYRKLSIHSRDQLAHTLFVADTRR